MTSAAKLRQSIAESLQIAGTDSIERLRLAAELKTEDGVARMILDGIRSDEQRAKVMADDGLVSRLKGMDGWLRYEAMLAPRDNPKARSEWLPARWSDSRSGWWAAAVRSSRCR